MKKIDLTKVTDNSLLKLGIALICISGMMQSSIFFEEATWAVDTFKYLAVLVCSFVALLQINSEFRISSIIKIVIIATMIVGTCFFSHDFSYMLVCMIILLSKNLKIYDFIKINFTILIFFSLIHIFLWCLNYTIDIGIPIYYNFSEKRISFCFTHPNIVAIKLGWGIIMYTWLYWDRLNFKNIFFCFIFTVILYRATKADSCAIFILYLCLVCFRKSRLLNKIVISISKYCFLMLGVFNIIIAKMYIFDKNVFFLSEIMDRVFNHRIAMSYLAIRDNGISIIGQSITKEHNWDIIFQFGNYTVDSLYVYMYVCIGVIYFVILSIGFIQLAKYKEYKVALSVIVFSLFALIEVHCLYLSNCFVIFLLKSVLFREKRLE